MRQFKTKTSKYVCAHVRLGDFDTLCGNFGSNKYYNTLQDQGFKCAAKIDDVVSYLRLQQLPALVLSDDPLAIKMGVQGLATPVATSEFVCDTVRKLKPKLTTLQLDVFCLVMEQELCAAAEHVRLNHFSTFSGRMAHMRDNK